MRRWSVRTRSAVGIFLLGSCWVREASPQGGVEARVEPWPRYAQAAVSVAFDDAYPSHVEVAMPLLEAHGFRGTFYLIVDKLWQRGKYTELPSVPIESWRAAAARGHEIGSHTSTHVALDTADAGRVEEELRGSKEALEAMLPGVRVTSLAYPFSRADGRVMQAAGSSYGSGRLGPAAAGEPVYNDPATADLLGLNSLFLCSKETPEQWNQAVDRTLEGGGWLVESLHPLDEEGYCRVRATDFAAHLDYLYQLGDRVWVAPVGEVAARIAEWRRVEIQIEVQAADRVTLQLAGTGSAEFDWQVVVAVEDPQDWRLADGDGRSYPVTVGAGTLAFQWPAAQRETAMLLHRAGVTVREVVSWGQVKQWRRAPAE